MKIPDFFIIGAPRCGTTAWSLYLGKHPDVFFSDVKEPHYFSDDFPMHQGMDLDTYLNLFSAASHQHLRVGEGSVWYLYSRDAAHRIHEFNPAARLIICLRNPVDMVHSLHTRLVLTGEEPIGDFETAWRYRKQAIGTLPPGQPLPDMRAYHIAGRFSPFVSRVLEIFPREQVHVILMEEFTASPQAIYRDTLSFLGLPDDHRTTFEQINATRHQVRRPGLNWLLAHPPRWARQINQGLGRLMGGTRVPWSEVRTALAGSKPVAVMSLSLRAEILAEFTDDIRMLEKGLNRSLDIWLRESPGKPAPPRHDDTPTTLPR